MTIFTIMTFFSFTPFQNSTPAILSLEGLSDSQLHRVSRTLFSILADLNNIVVLILSTRPLISKSSSPFNNSLVTARRAPIIIGITITFIFHSFFNYLVRTQYLSFFSFSFNFTLWLAGTAKSIILQVLSFFFIDNYKIWLFGRDKVICLYVNIPLKSEWVRFSRTDAGFCRYYLLVWSNLNFLHIFQWITLPTQLYLVLYSHYYFTLFRVFHTRVIWWFFYRSLCDTEPA